jgi:hypothetical protein
MRVDPDHICALRDEQNLSSIVRGYLERALAPEPVKVGREIGYPGFVAIAHQARRTAKAELAARVPAVAARATRSSSRAAAGIGDSCWAADLAPPEPHLSESLRRALAGLPEHRSGRTVDLAVVGWDDGHRRVFERTRDMLAAVWPEMLAELSATVRQVALLKGWGIDGYTDFVVHGAIFVNTARLGDGSDGLPAHIRLAEALVHEGTHSRCNAGAATEPVLVSAEAASARGPLVPTPLRADPRPVSGLFQQVLVLARCVALYDRLPASDAVRARRERLLGQGRQGVATLRAHLCELTSQGRALVDEAAVLLQGAARRAESPVAR